MKTWNKGLKGWKCHSDEWKKELSKRFSGKNNPMCNPENVKKMVATRRKNNVIKPWNKGLTKETSVKLKEIGIKISISQKKNSEKYSKRMKLHNPMHEERYRKLVSLVLKGRPNYKIRGDNNPSKRPDVKEKLRKRPQCKLIGQRLVNNKNRLLALVQRPSKPQYELFLNIKNKFSEHEVVLEYPIKRKNGKYYFLDIAIPKLKIDIEFDGEYFHKDKKRDEQRDNELQEMNWKIFRFTYQNYKEDWRKIIL